MCVYSLVVVTRHLTRLDFLWWLAGLILAVKFCGWLRLAKMTYVANGSACGASGPKLSEVWLSLSVAQLVCGLLTGMFSSKYPANVTMEIPGSIPGRRTLCAIVRTGKFRPGDKQGSLRTQCTLQLGLVICETAFSSNPNHWSLIVLVGPKGRATQFFTLTFHYLVGGWLARLARFSKL